MIEPEHEGISIRRQCELIGLNRSSWYYRAVGENEYNLELMRLIDKEYTQNPFYGYRRITAVLQRAGHEVNKKRIARLMQKMGLQAIYPRSKARLASKEHRIYPYLLRDVEISHGIKSGAQILPIYRCPKGLCIWSL
ncbi:IS3 family transposase [Chloroflexi bacterium TSY]|nr:IS3 family transposase [Chloroflexi bacterium TSY]